MPMSKLLEIDNLTVAFDTDEGSFNAVDRVSFHIRPGETVGLVGESGCGKTVTALSILRLIASPPGRIRADRIRFKDKNLLTLTPKEMRRIRGREISMIFQEPGAALSPLHTVGAQLTEALLLHQDIRLSEARSIAENWLKNVGIPDAGQRMNAYPWQLSGGMQQRVMIAMALMMEPDLVIADEPTTALDVTIQAQIFELIRGMKKKETSILLITHDMGVVWEMCDRVIVMYASRIAEEGSLTDIFSNPSHPYTQGLLKSIPRMTGGNARAVAIPGYVPSPLNYPSGCRFHDRCAYRFDRCSAEEPSFVEIKSGHRAACFRISTHFKGRRQK